MTKKRWMLPWRLIRDALALAAVFAIPAFSSLLIGRMLDQRQNSDPIFTLVLLGLGVGCGFYGLISILRHMNRRRS